MTIRISETIHKWMGWCPVKSAITVPVGTEGYETKPGRSPGGPERIVNDRIVDYSPAGTSILHFLTFGIGIAVIVSFIKLISLIFIGADIILLFCILLTSAFLLTYNDFKKTSIESCQGTIIIHRPIFKPVIIPKDEITAAEINDNRRPVPQWVIAAFALLLVPVYSVTGLYNSYMNWVSGGYPTSTFIIYIGFLAIITLFFVSLYNYSRTRYKCPKNLVITTKKNKKLVIYGKDPEELAEIKETLI